MKRLCLLIAVWCIVAMGCDNTSESRQNVQFFPQSPVGAVTIREVPANYPTIQKAVDAAGSGDMIRVAAGTYAEDVTITSKRFSLRGAGQGKTTIEGTVRINESADVSFEGFTVTEGGIYAYQSSIIISGNAITNNPGSGLSLNECSHVLISDNAISDNRREGILINASSGVFGSNIVTENATDGVVLTNSSLQVVANIISDNGRDGIAIRGIEYSASPNLLQNTIHNNGGASSYDIICFGGNANPTGAGNIFSKCINCAECRSFSAPITYEQ